MDKSLHIPLHTSLKSNPKIREYRKNRRCTYGEALVDLIAFWWWAIEFCGNGNLDGIDYEDIAFAAGCGLTASKLESMKTVGFINDDNTIHDWNDYGGKLFLARQANAENMRQYRLQNPDCKDNGKNNGNNNSNDKKTITPYSESESESEKELKSENASRTVRQKPPDGPPEAIEIINYFNTRNKTNYRPFTEKHLTPLKARLKEGWTVEDFKRVIDIMSDAWEADPKSVGWVRPQTFFTGNFESYLNRIKPVSVGMKVVNKLQNRDLTKGGILAITGDIQKGNGDSSRSLPPRTLGGLVVDVLPNPAKQSDG